MDCIQEIKEHRKIPSIILYVGRTMKKEKISNKFLLVMIGFTFGLFWYFFAGTTSNINTTMLAFNYKYGFISRGLLGTIYSVLDAILPWDLYTYRWAMFFFEGCLLVFVVLLFVFCMQCLKRCEPSVKESVQYLIILYFICAIPMFSSEYNLGRLDMFCLMCSMLSVLLMVYGKAEWLTLPLSATGVLFHQGHVFMYMGMVLALQVYKALDAVKEQDDIKEVFHNRTSRKYLALFLLTFFTVSALFIWFEGFSHVNGKQIVDEIIDTACRMGPNADYHIDVVDHEMLGVDLSAKEWEYHKQNFVELPLYCLLVLPYILIAIRFFKGLLASAKTKIDKWKYMIIIVGSVTILPDMILKVDYGRWVFAIISYYIVVLLALHAMKDNVVEEQGQYTLERLKSRYSYAGILLVYPLLFQPLMHISICPLTERIVNIINVHFNIWIPWQ